MTEPKFIPEDMLPKTNKVGEIPESGSRMTPDAEFSKKEISEIEQEYEDMKQEFNEAESAGDEARKKNVASKILDLKKFLLRNKK